MNARILSLALLSTVVSSASAQAPFSLGAVNGLSSPEQLGSQNALAGLGDVTGDGIPDFVAGAPGWPMPTRRCQGRRSRRWARRESSRARR
jgi:hypothetical protein